MPDIDGVELLRRLNADAMLPAIVVTGHGDVQMAVEAMKNGALDFIEKPFSDEVLIESIRRAVELAASQRGRGSRESRTRERLASLSEREIQVLQGVVQGQANKTIAFELGISPRTVEVYRAGLMSKMQAKSLAELVRMVMDIDLDASGRHRSTALIQRKCGLDHAPRPGQDGHRRPRAVPGYVPPPRRCADSDLRQSLEFALAAEGHEVTWRPASGPSDLPCTMTARSSTIMRSGRSAGRRGILPAPLRR